MHGENEPTKPFDFGTWHVVEMFHTLQGEGFFAGVPSVFVRFAHCNMKCWYCDTEFTKVDKTYTDITELTADVITMVGEHSWPTVPPHIVVTGGEPFLYDLAEFILAMFSQGYTVEVETSGTVATRFPTMMLEDPRLHITCSPKAPCVVEDMQWASAWKYVVQAGHVNILGLPVGPNPQGGERSVAYPTNAAPVYLQPCSEVDRRKYLLNQREAVAACLKYGHCLSLQTHKIIGVP